MFLSKAGLNTIIPGNMQIQLQFRIALNTLAYLAHSKVAKKKSF